MNQEVHVSPYVSAMRRGLDDFGNHPVVRALEIELGHLTDSIQAITRCPVTVRFDRVPPATQPKHVGTITLRMEGSNEKCPLPLLTVYVIDRDDTDPTYIDCALGLTWNPDVMRSTIEGAGRARRLDVHSLREDLQGFVSTMLFAAGVSHFTLAAEDLTTHETLRKATLLPDTGSSYERALRSGLDGPLRRVMLKLHAETKAVEQALLTLYPESARARGREGVPRCELHRNALPSFRWHTEPSLRPRVVFEEVPAAPRAEPPTVGGQCTIYLGAIEVSVAGDRHVLATLLAKPTWTTPTLLLSTEGGDVPVTTAQAALEDIFSRTAVMAKLHTFMQGAST